MGKPEKIAKHHERNMSALSQTAEYFANVLRSFGGVHSVRWRVKAVDHLLEKIIRKRVGNEEKYADISVENYREKVTDLIGLRALHLFKGECFEIHRCLQEHWKIIEGPIAYLRDGDDTALRAQFEDSGFTCKDHPDGYRSVHYVLESSPGKTPVLAEVQVRTVFEEGWSEIDHRIRYPNFSNNELVGFFLRIFNRTAGSADEMGSFVRNLAAITAQHEAAIDKANTEVADTLSRMDELVEQLGAMKQASKDSQGTISNLRSELEKLKSRDHAKRRSSALGLGSLIPPDELSALRESLTMSLAERARLEALGDLSKADLARMGELGGLSSIMGFGLPRFPGKRGGDDKSES